MAAYHGSRSRAIGADESLRPPVAAPRTRAAHWVPRRIYYVLGYLKRQLVPGKARALSNYRTKEALHFGSEGEISQIMRWLAGEQPTMGRWAYGVLNTPQIYRFITRERMPAGGYLITLLAVPTRIDPPKPDAVQLSFLDDPSMIPLFAHQDAANEGSSTAMPVRRADLRRQDAVERESQGDQHEDTVKESNKQQHGACAEKHDWANLTIDGAQFIPIHALQKAGHTPESVQAADAKMRTRREYDTRSQAKILFDGLLHNTPIYSAAEMAARSQEADHVQSHSTPAATAGRSERHARRDPHPQRGRRAERSGARGRAAGTSHVDPSVYAAILAEAVPLDLADDLSL